MSKVYDEYDVWQNGIIVCANLTKQRAESKVENERRIGNVMSIKPARKFEPDPHIIYLTEEEDD